MEEIIPVVNQLQELFSSVEGEGLPKQDDVPSLLDLPQVAVVGSQSVGKSSILEGLMRQPCLPRGLGMVTRCPLIIQLRTLRGQPLVQLPDDQSDFYCQFAHTGNTVYTNPQEISLEIQKQTKHILAQETPPLSVSPLPIILKLYSPNVVDLTLIDLPGLIRVPTSDQPHDVDEQVKKIVMQYISSPSCIILAVSAANNDLANSDSLRIAREVDPLGNRTIGVLTKVDLVEDATSVLSIVEGRVYPLQKGYVLVKCRSQKESVTLDRSLLLESNFFESHPIFCGIHHQCGLKHLGRKLSQILMHHIRQLLPSLKVKIDSMLCKAEEEAQALGTPPEAGTPAGGALLLQVFTRYARMVDDLLDGRAVPGRYSQGSCGCELIGGARLHYIFHDWFATCVMRLNSLAGLSDREIKTAIRNASGSSTSLFVPESAFEMLVKRQIKKLEQPAVQCVQQAVQELMTIMTFPLSQMTEFRQYKNLEQRVSEICREVVDGHLAKTLTAVTDFIQIELAFINKAHPDFITGKKAISNFLGARALSESPDEKTGQTSGPSDTQTNLLRVPMALTPTTGLSDSDEARSGNAGAQGFLTFWRRHPLQQTPAPVTALPPPNNLTARLRVGRGSQSARDGLPPTPLMLPMIGTETSENTDRDTLELELVKALISSYFEIIKKTLSDIVPKSIMHFLVNASREDIHRELVSKLYKEDHFPMLLEEAPDIPQERARVKARVKLLRKASATIQGVGMNEW